MARPGPFPMLRKGGVLSFSLPGVGDAAALVSGWTALDPGGAILDGPHPDAHPDTCLDQAGVNQPLAVLCFGRNEDVAPGSVPGSDAGPLMVELLIRTQVSASDPEPAGDEPAAPPVPVLPPQPCVLGVSLNGYDLGEIRPFGVAPGSGGARSGGARSGVAGSRFKVPAALWQPQDPQVLVLDWRQPATDPGNAVTLALVAVALSPLPPAAPDWAASAAASVVAAPVAVPLAPLLRCATPPVQPDLPGAALAVSFRAFAPPGFATRGRGWSLPEMAGTWSTGGAAVIQFAAPFVASTPALLSLTGHSLPVDPTAAQRIGLASGPDHLATLVIPAAAGSTADLALPGSLLAQGIDHLLLQFPDAASPRDLGMNEDDRRLGLHLGGFTLRRTGRRVFAYQGTPDTLPDRILACPGVLRLSGTRQRSKPGTGLQLHLSGQPVFAAVFAQAADGPAEQRWECCLPLTPALVAEGALFVHLLTDEGRGPPAQPPALPPVIDTIEVWAEQDQPLTEMRLVPAQVPLPPATDLRRWLAATRAGHEAKLHSLPLRLPRQMRFGAGLADLSLLGAGWSAPEPDQVWTDGPEAVLHLGGALHPADHLLTLTAGALITPGHSCQRSLLRLGGQPVASLLLRSGDSAAHQIVVPAELISATPGPATLQVDLPDAISPAALGLSADSRMLGLRLQGLALERLPPGPVTKTGAGIAWADPAGPDPALSDWTLQLLGAGGVIAVAGTGAPPFGLSVQGSAVVAHPVRPGAGLAAGWRVLLHLPPEAASTSARHLLLIHHRAADGRIDPDRHAPGPTLVITA